jgi:hypothetical protein
LGQHIGLVIEFLGNGDDLLFGGLAYPGFIVQRPVYRGVGNPCHLGYILYGGMPSHEKKTPA